MVNRIYFVLFRDKTFDTSLEVYQAFRNLFSTVTETTALCFHFRGGEDD